MKIQKRDWGSCTFLEFISCVQKHKAVRELEFLDTKETETPSLNGSIKI